MRLLARFAVLYAALLGLCFLLPVYAWIEQVAVRAADALLPAPGAEEPARALALERGARGWRYVYRVGDRGALDRPYHRHGFPLVIFVALVLATPGLPASRRAVALATGLPLLFAVSLAILMSDVQDWERAALTPLRGPWPRALDLVRAVHTTSLHAILPLVLWLFFLPGPPGAQSVRGRASNSTTTRSV